MTTFDTKRKKMKDMNFEFATATRIVFGLATASQLGKLGQAFGKHALIVTGSQPDRIGNVIQFVKDSNLNYTVYPIHDEPSISVIDRGKALGQSAGCDFVISIGGGSVIDAGKAIAAMLANEGEILDYLEVIGKGHKLLHDPLPFIAVPTTSGTGAEVTKNAVVSSPEHKVKVSLRDNRMLPNIALVDPTLTLSMPASVTASTGMDALTQVLEPYVSHLANPITDAFCIEGLQRAGRSLRVVFDDPENEAAREDMALVSLLGGLALANAKLGAVHGFAGTLGGMFAAPHGEICATLLPHVFTTNLRALQEREPVNPIIPRFDEIGKLLTGNDKASAQDAVDWINETSQMFQIPSLSKHGVTTEDFNEIIDKSSRSSSMKGNPIQLTDTELNDILRAAL